MKNMFRAVVLLVLVGGWALAGSALHVVRTPTNVVLIPKSHLAFRDTFLDTRTWTIADDRAHPAFVGWLLATGRGTVLTHTVDNTNPLLTADAQLAQAVSNPTTATGGPPTPVETAIDKAKGELKTVGDAVKASLPKT